MENNEEQEEEEECTILEKEEADIVANILDDCIIKLSILGHRLPVPAMQPEIPEYRTLDEKYGIEETKKYSETSSPYSPSMIKLQKDRTLLEHILKETMDELNESQSFSKLHAKVTQFQREYKEERRLLTELIELGLTAPGLKKELASAKQKTQVELRQSLQTLAKIQDKVARVQNAVKSQLSLAESWESARASQLNLKLNMAEEDLENKLEEVSKQTDIELRVHTELETFLEHTIHNLNVKADMWKNKYHKDKTEKEEKLKALKEKRDKNMKQLKELADLYRRHRKELKDYESVRYKKQLALERIKYENDMATKIQAWWKGVMVRRGLGPYKKKKKPVKEKSASKKKP